MECLFLLSGENLELAKQEVLSLTGSRNHSQYENLLIIEVNDIEILKRLAYIKEVHQILFETDINNLENQIETFEWGNEYKGDFKVIIKGFTKKEVNSFDILSKKEIASVIWHKLTAPKVNLEKPKTLFSFFKNKNRIYALKLVHKNTEEFEKRKNQNLPGKHPSSLHPKLARAMVNLSKIKKGTIIDPFCGAGGLLLEAGLMGFEIKGYDLNLRMLKKAKLNLDFFNLKEYSLEKKDALTLEEAEYIVTDLPYGKNTKVKDVEKLYLKFFKVIKNIQSKKVVIGLPDFVDHIKLLEKAELETEKEFNYYLHKSLSKRILVLRH